jgi:hypothetical protein
MEADKEKKVQGLAEDIEKYLQNNSYNRLARLIVKNIPKGYYNRLFWILHCTNNDIKK